MLIIKFYVDKVKGSSTLKYMLIQIIKGDKKVSAQGWVDQGLEGMWVLVTSQISNKIHELIHFGINFKLI